MRLLPLVTCTALLISACPDGVSAQVLTPMQPISAEAELARLRQLQQSLQSPSLTATAELAQKRDDVAKEIVKAQTEAASGADFLRQGGFAFGTGASELTLQAADLFFSKHLRFFLRSTVPVTADDDAQQEAGQTPALTVDDNIKGALGSPHAGLVYTSVGFLPRIPTQKDDKGNWTRRSLGRTEAQYGLFADVRFGVKAIELPKTGSTGTAPIVHEVTIFYTGNAGLRLELPLFNDAAATSQAGGFGLAVLGVWNRATDPSVSQLFSGDNPKLRKDTGSLNVSVGVLLSNIAYLSLEGTAWTSSTLGKKWTLGLNLLRN